MERVEKGNESFDDYWEGSSYKGLKVFEEVGGRNRDERVVFVV